LFASDCRPDITIRLTIHSPSPTRYDVRHAARHVDDDYRYMPSYAVAQHALMVEEECAKRDKPRARKRQTRDPYAI